MKTINNLSSIDSLSLGDLLAIWNTNNGDTRKVSITTLVDFISSNIDIDTLILDDIEDLPAANQGDVAIVKDISRGGIFEYNASLSRVTDANNGTIINPNGISTGFGCWVRQYSGAVNVKWFGAGTSDDTSIIQGIIDNVATYEIYFPLGTYYFSSITIPNDVKNIHLTGDGNKRTTLTQLASATAPLIRFGSSDARYNIGYISNLKLEGNSKQNEGLHLRNTARASLRNIEITNFDKGLYLSGSQEHYFENFEISGCNTGVYIREQLAGDTTTAKPNLNTLNDFHITGCSNYAVDFDDGAGLKITNTQIDFNGTTGDSDKAIWIRSNASTETGYNKVPALFLDNVWLEGNNGDNWLRIDNGGLFMQNCQSYDNEGGAFVNTSNPCTVINCTGATTGDTFKLRDSNDFGVFINSIFQSNIIGVNSSEVTTKLSPFTININSTNGTEGFIGKPAFSAYATTTQSLTTGVYTKVPLGFESYDKASNFDTVSYSFVAPMTGVYHFDGTAWIEGSLTRALIAIYKNGIRVKVGNYSIMTATELHPVISCDLVLAENDVIEMYVLAYGTSLQLRGDSTTTYLDGKLILGA